MCNLLSVYCYEVRKIWFVLVQRTKRYKFHFRLPSFMPSLTKSALYAESGALIQSTRSTIESIVRFES